MKKFFSLVLALVMALSLTTVAWGATDALQDAIAAGQTDITLTAGNYTMPQNNVLQGKTLTISGPREAVIDISAVVTNGSQAFMGTTLVFEGVTINGSTSARYKGFTHAASLTYKNCKLTGLQTLYADTVVFEDCEFDSTANTVEPHAVWTWSAKNVTFTDCEFTYGDRAVNVYGQYDVAGGQTVTFEECTFTTTSGTSTGAVEINGSGITSGVDVSLDDCTAPANGELAYVSQWDSTGGANTDVFVDDALVGAVAEVNGVQYKVFADALTAAGAGDTIVLLDDVAGEVTIGQPVTIAPNGYAVTVKAATGYQVVKNTAGEYVVTAAVTFGDKFDLYLADSGMATALKLGAEDVSGLSFNEVDAKTNQDGSGRVAYIAANNGQFFVKTTAPTTTSYAVTYAGKTDVLYYVNLGPAGAGYYEYSDTCDVVTEFGVKCGQCAFTNTAYTANPLKTYFVLADEETVCESKAAVADPQYNFLVNGVVYSGTIVGKVVDHSFTANDFDYNATLKQNVPTSAICTKCLMVSTSIYLDGKVPAGKAFYDIANATAYSVVAEAAAGTVVTPSTDKVTSAETFDAGIAMYVGMSVMAAAGSAVVLKKKD